MDERTTEYRDGNSDILHIVIKGGKEAVERTDYGDESQYMQTAKHCRAIGRDAPAHEHIENIREIRKTQESWVIMSGCIIAQLYDSARKLIAEIKLTAGDCLVSYGGGHGFTVVEDVVMYEFKNGPYLGRAKDKVFY